MAKPLNENDRINYTIERISTKMSREELNELYEQFSSDDDYVNFHVDNIEDTQSFFLSTWLKAVRNALGQHTWIVLSITLFILMLLGFLFFAFSQTLWVRKTAFYLSVIALVISVVACINAGSLHSRDTQRAEAIITQGVVNAKSSPDRSGNDLFTVHEGTKVEITEVIGPCD